MIAEPAAPDPTRPNGASPEKTLSPRQLALTDEQLAILVARRQVWAYGEIYDRYAILIYSLALKILNDPASAEDIVQQVFANVWHNAHHYEPTRGKFSSWLIAISRHQMIDDLRQRRSCPMSKLTDGTPGPEMDPLEHAPNASEYARVRHGLEQIPYGQRSIIELAYFGGFSCEEIADQHGVSSGVIKTRIDRGMKKLKELLNK